MELEFGDDDLARLETELDFRAGRSDAIVKAFRKRIQFIRAATDERDFYAMRSLRFEKLKGDRSHQYSMRLNDQWRLILEIRSAEPKNIIVVVKIEDYH
jgi:toxin HigB-1